MRNSKNKTIVIGGVDYSRFLSWPYTFKKALNEELDVCFVDLKNTRIKDPFKPFLRVTLGGDSSYIVSTDDVTEVYGTGSYNHTLTLIEQTKETERIIMGAKSFTNPLPVDHSKANNVVEYIGGNGGVGSLYEFVISRLNFTTNNTVSPIVGTELNIYLSDFKEKWEIRYPETDVDGTPLTGYLRIFFGKNDHGTVSPTYEIDEKGYMVISKDATVVFDSDVKRYSDITIDVADYGEGVYTVVYAIDSSVKNDVFIFDIYMVMDDEAVHEPYTIDQVIGELLDVCETSRAGIDTPRYVLDVHTGDMAERLKGNAPELHFSNGRSLFENLREIGKYIHGIPRAKGDKIRFDELGGGEYADLSKGKRYYGTSSLNIGDYVAGLETFANNMINIDDPDEGSITEPFTNGYTTMRASTEEARIQEGTGFFPTAYPIERIISVKIMYNLDGIGKEVDVTPYVFEKSEYDLLSNFSGQYPRSKTYALSYTRGSKNIDGLWYKAGDNPISMANVFERYSIINVINAAGKMPSGLDVDEYTDIMARITYLPTVSAVARQYKPEYNGVFPSIMVYNQSANRLSSRAMGENMRGQLAMLGTTSDTVMYIFPNVEDVPRAGTLYDKDNYISQITARVFPDFVLTEIGLSTGYNELGAFVESNNAIRQFEIPDGEDRYTVLEEFCLIGEKEDNQPNRACTNEMLNTVINTFVESESGTIGRTDISHAVVRTLDKNLSRLSHDFVLPVISLSFGTSLYFGFRFEDNFSAGRKAVPSDKNYKWQEYAPYGDVFYGKAEHLSFELRRGGSMPVGFDAAVEAADSLPALKNAGGTAMVVVPASAPVIWHKDGADAGCVTYQLHFMTNDGHIIGEGLARMNPSVRNTPSVNGAKIYFFNRRINQLTGTTDTTGAVYVADISANVTERYISYLPFDESITFKSWAIIKNGEFLMGKNTDQRPNKIYFTIKRRLNT